MKEKDQYLKIVEWSEEDQCYVGSIPGWIGKCCHGNDEKKVYAQLCKILDEWIEIYKKDKRPLPAPTNKKYSGRFVLRIDRDLHKVLAIQASNEGESLNNFVSKKLTKMVYTNPLRE
ncbi:MAG: type II toxin-antitoxin system HicB family antitoxin [Deltaproteobacteria bacterium]|nr:type II toxin-antitoxin system HicB family antitoxin [Deltaproteobacteria bacterium]